MPEQSDFKPPFLTEPEFDADGYPNEATLADLATWPIERAAEGLAFMAKAWMSAQDVTHELRPYEAETVGVRPGCRYWRFATGGWSGNESLIAAFMESPAAFVTWALDARGGLHIFEERVAEVRRLHDELTGGGGAKRYKQDLIARGEAVYEGEPITDRVTHVIQADGFLRRIRFTS